MRKTLIVAVVAGLALFGSLTAVSANHDHNLTFDGATLVEDFANGQTEKCASDPGGHKLHEKMHIGQPGTFAFAQPNNPLGIIKTENATC
ncbi:MAG TPA: hypothetical protein VMR52_08685 [Dehalococcoidia bacterium]|nr:hypothetical protein [Dehalococcoidia bacterium]